MGQWGTGEAEGEWQGEGQREGDGAWVEEGEDKGKRREAFCAWHSNIAC